MWALTIAVILILSVGTAWFFTRDSDDEELDDYDLTIGIEGEGSTDPNEGTHTHEEDTEVIVEATPDEGWEFVEWTGDVSGNGPTMEIIMDEDMEITAHFEVYEYTLNVDTEGGGEVEVEPDQTKYEHGEEVNLTALPDDDWGFNGWKGDVPEDTSDDWRWMYPDNWRAEFDFGIGFPTPGIWYGAMRIDLSEDVGNVLTEVAYYDYEDGANYAQLHVAENQEGGDWGEPGKWLASTEKYEPTGAGWVELELKESVMIEEPGEYWVVIELDDYGEDNFPFGGINPAVQYGSLINQGDAHDPEDWECMNETHGLDDTGGLEAKVEESKITIDMEENTDITVVFEELEAEFEITDLTINPDRISVGNETNISVDVTNVGDSSGSKQVKFEVGEETINKDVTLNPEETKEVSTSVIMTEEGEYEVSVNGLTETLRVIKWREIGEPYEGANGLTVILNSFEVEEKEGSYQYHISYTLENNKDRAITEGRFKLYYEDEAGGLPQYGTFGDLYPGDNITRTYTFEEEKQITFDTLAYHHDQFHEDYPPEDSLKWAVEY